jgi:hypothetical protein
MQEKTNFGQKTKDIITKFDDPNTHRGFWSSNSGKFNFHRSGV